MFLIVHISVVVPADYQNYHMEHMCSSNTLLYLFSMSRSQSDLARAGKYASGQSQRSVSEASVASVHSNQAELLKAYLNEVSLLKDNASALAEGHIGNH